jgi:hypothetical protein
VEEDRRGKTQASTRSSKPLAPVTETRWPQLVMPRSRFNAFITRCPIEPAAQAMKAMTSACPGLNGVTKENTMPTRLPRAMPIPQGIQLKLLLIAGTLGGRFSRRVTRCCATMQLCTTKTRRRRGRRLLLIAADVQQQQRGHVAHAVDAHHDAPLQLGVALQERCVSPARALTSGIAKEHVHGDEHGEEVEVGGAGEPELQRQHHEERQHQAAVVAAPRRRQGDELAQCEESDHAEQDRRRGAAGSPADPEHHHHEPGATEQLLKIESASSPSLPKPSARRRKPRKNVTVLTSASSPKTMKKSAPTCSVG